MGKVVTASHPVHGRRNVDHVTVLTVYVAVAPDGMSNQALVNEVTSNLESLEHDAGIVSVDVDVEGE